MGADEVTAATNRLTVSIDEIAHTVPVNVRNGVMFCPDDVNYECRTGKGLWDVVYRDLAADFDAREATRR